MASSTAEARVARRAFAKVVGISTAALVSEIQVAVAVAGGVLYIDKEGIVIVQRCQG